MEQVIMISTKHKARASLAQSVKARSQDAIRNINMWHLS